MQSISFKGAIHDLLGELFLIKDGFSIGEKLTHLEKQLPKKKLFYASDEEIHDALEKIKKTDYYTEN